VNIDLSYTWAALPQLLYGAIITVEVSLAAMALSLVLAIALTMLQTSGNRIARGFVRAYISYVRGTPLLIQIFIIFYIVPLPGARAVQRRIHHRDHARRACRDS
jgi:polar amino acid transport system permease protein